MLKLNQSLRVGDDQKVGVLDSNLLSTTKTPSVINSELFLSVEASDEASDEASHSVISMSTIHTL